jgi:rare lipoprotein A
MSPSATRYPRHCASASWGFLAALLVVISLQANPARAEMPRPDAGAPTPNAHRPATGHQIDLSGLKRIGKASYYANRFAGRKMADGTRMDPEDDNAASKTLPLGTRARVTNLETGQSTTVTIQDRGPYVKGRIVDLSPSTAREIGITRRAGVAKVEVAPIAVPLPDGTVKPGEGSR